MSIAASIRCLAYCAKTDTLVSGSFDQTLHVWRIPGPGKEKSETKLLGKLLGACSFWPPLRVVSCSGVDHWFGLCAVSRRTHIPHQERRLLARLACVHTRQRRSFS